MSMHVPHDRLAGSVLVAALAFASPARATQFHVGAGCDYATIAAALTAAANDLGGNKEILVANNQAYTNQALTVDGMSITIEGVPACNYVQPSGNTTIGGGSGHSVLTIRGDSHVRLRNLTISDGHPSDGAAGGGIDFAGTGTLSIDHTTISSNHAGYGGGINFNGSGGVAYLGLNAGTQILSNTATTSGGGVRIEGNAVLTITAPQVWLAFNEAVGGYGGGLEVIGPARADLGSPGYRVAEYAGLLYENSAQYGGGMAIFGGSGANQHAIVRLLATDPANPVMIRANGAAQTGGAVYLQPDAGPNQSFATLCGIDYRLTDNTAQEGSAIYADEDSTSLDGYTGSFVSLGPYANDADCTQTALPAGVVACTSETCSSIDHNVSQNTAGQATAGSAILLQTNSIAELDRIRIEDNTGEHALRLVGGGGEFETTSVTVSNALLAGNSERNELVLAETGTELFVRNATLTGNQSPSGVVIRANGRLTVSDSIFAQGPASSALFGGAAADLHLDHILSMEIASLAGGDHIVQGDPSFVDVAQGDYHLRPNSLAIDVAPAVVGDDRDLDGRPHDQDIASVADQDGDRDLGAFERQQRYCGAADTVFCATFDFD
ncbi:MAG TPA: hypothetical protein VFS55_06930 [Dokdonella sp.]|nr:hypothetical protein [Dokdonella sp.]